jgi:signal transduction histidine kinase
MLKTLRRNVQHLDGLVEALVHDLDPIAHTRLLNQVPDDLVVYAGIPQERLEKVFEKSETDPDKESGWGLGLAIVKTFVEADDGSVSVESKQGLGSTFRFTLPARQSAAAA